MEAARPPRCSPQPGHHQPGLAQGWKALAKATQREKVKPSSHHLVRAPAGLLSRRAQLRHRTGPPQSGHLPLLKSPVGQQGTASRCHSPCTGALSCPRPLLSSRLQEIAWISRGRTTLGLWRLSNKRSSRIPARYTSTPISATAVRRSVNKISSSHGEKRHVRLYPGVCTPSDAGSGRFTNRRTKHKQKPQYLARYLA